MRRPLPTAAEAADILSAKRTRPVRRPPPAAGAALGRYLKALDARFEAAGAAPRALVRRWREVVGDVLSRRTEPVRLVRSRRGDGATLEVRVDGPAAALIQHQSEEIIARVNLALGAGTVGRLRLTQGPVRGAPAPRTSAPRRVRTPLDAGQEAALAGSLSDAPDGPLKTALLRLGREVMRRG